MAGGRVLQFDQARGYGFVAADDGGEDIFLHASVFDGDSAVLVPGVRVEFEVMAGDRGRKAYAAHLAPGEADPDGQQAPAPQRQGAPDHGSPATASAALDEDQLCDVLSAHEFRQELTELLLHVTPPLAGDQILAVRRSMLEFAKHHGWVDA